MTKGEIKAKMVEKGILNTNGSRDPLWVEAFQLFNDGQTQKLKMGCGSCYSKVRNWLNS